MWLQTVFCPILFHLVYSYDVPDVQVEVLKAGGFRAFIPDEPGVKLFTFNANINKDIQAQVPGQISGEALAPNGGVWEVTSSKTLYKDDELSYWVFVQHQKVGYTKRGFWKFSGVNCLISRTTINGGNTVCSGKLIFDEQFDTIGNDWVKEQKFPSDFDDFVSFQTNPTYLHVENGSLIIRAIAADTVSGELDFGDRCTGQANTPECHRMAVGAFILPPVISANVNTKNKFSFKYGKVEIRAKLPKGEWVYPQMFLEPVQAKYGQKYASGKIIVALANGNRELLCNGHEIGNKFLYGGGLIASFEKINEFLKNGEANSKGWSEEFHIFTVIWDESQIKAYVDDKMYHVFDKRLKEHIKSKINLPYGANWTTDISPFDQEMFLSLSIRSGGHEHFFDGCQSCMRTNLDGTNCDAHYSKPWNNFKAKAMYQFFTAKNEWFPSWSSETSLKIDYIKIWAL